jgi:hypothetical protein
MLLNLIGSASILLGLALAQDGFIINGDLQAHLEVAKNADGCCPNIMPRCMPDCNDNDQCYCTDSTTGEFVDCCCEFEFINEYDFFLRYPKLSGPGKDFSYYQNGDFIADGGSLVFGPKGGLLNTNVYTTYVMESSISYLDNFKYLVFHDEPVQLTNDGEIVIEYQVEAMTYRTDRSPYPEVLLKCAGDDVRLAAASFNVYDPNTEFYFNFLLTNDMVYAVYGRYPDARGILDLNYAAFTFVIPMLWRKPSDKHHLKIILGKRDRIVRWKIDNVEAFRVVNVGARIDRQYMTKDYGGADDDSSFPQSVLYGFGSMTLLDNYPACWKACSNLECIFPPAKRALLQTGNEFAPETYDPQVGKPYPAEYWNTCPTKEYHLWGQGSTTLFKRLSVYQQKCKQRVIHRP